MPASGTTFALGTTTVTCSATDAAGNTGTNTFTVEVQDVTKPIVTVPADQTVEATGAERRHGHLRGGHRRATTSTAM